MPPRRLIVPFIVAILSSCTTASQRSQAPLEAPPAASSGASHKGLVSVGADGAIWLIREGSRTLEKWDQGATAVTLRSDLPILPAVLRPAPDGGVVAAGVSESTIVDAAGRAGPVRKGIDATEAEQLVYRGGRLLFATAGGEAGVDFSAPAVRAARLIGEGRAVVLAADGPGESLFVVSAGEGAIRIAGPFAAVDSFDVSPDGSEIAFAANRGAGFDVGLVAAGGSEVRWIGPDPLEERMVRWAPRGNKIAYVMETSGGALVRSVHIPTGFQLSVPLPLTEIRDLAWEPAAERLAILVSSADAGERVEWIRYDGAERVAAVPASSLRSESPDQLAGVPEAVLFAPEAVRYNEKLPLVVWGSREGAFAWNEARAEVQQNRRIGSIVVGRGAAARAALWEAIAELPWVDPRQVFLVASDPAEPPGDAVPEGMHLTVLAPEGRSGAESERVTVVRSGSRPLEEFAVLWLSERLRGFEREHDGS